MADLQGAWESVTAVADEDGPHPLACVWKVLNGPGEPTVEGGETTRPVFTFDAPGVYTVALEVDDGEARARYSWQVEVDGLYRVSMTSEDGELLLMSANRFPVNIGVDFTPAQALTLGYTLGGDGVAGEDFAALSGTLTLAAGADTAVIDLQALTRMAGESRTLTLTLEEGEGYELGADTSVTITLLPYTYANWAAYFANESGSGAGNWSPAFDANADGFGNLIKYALGVDPVHATDAVTRERLPQLKRTPGGQLALSYIRPENADASLYAVGSSPSPTGLPFTGLEAPEVVESNGDGTETVTVTDPQALQARELRFLFLRVETATQ